MKMVGWLTDCVVVLISVEFNRCFQGGIYCCGSGLLLFRSCVAVLAWPLKLFHCFFQEQRAFGNKLYLVFIFGVCK